MGEGLGAAVAPPPSEVVAPGLLSIVRSALACRRRSRWITRLGGAVQRDGAGDVTAINLGDTWVNDTDILDLLAFKKLQKLDLSHTRISDEGLLSLKPARQIEDLNLLYAELITDLGMNAVKGWRQLKRLNVRGTKIANDTLVIVGDLVHLESLDIANTRITDSGLENLAPLTRLKSLALGRSGISESAMGILRLLSTLEFLDLSGPVVSQRRGRASGAMQDSMVSAITALDSPISKTTAMLESPPQATLRARPTVGMARALNCSSRPSRSCSAYDA